MTKPRAFDIGGGKSAVAGEAGAEPARIERQPDAFPLDAEPAEAPRRAQTRPARWLLLALSALGGLVLLLLANALVQRIQELIAGNSVLGWIAAGLAAVALAAATLWIGREARAILRLSRIARLRAAADAAIASRNAGQGLAAVRALVALYGNRPDTAEARARLQAIETELIDGDARLAIAERVLMGPLDRRARAAVAQAAKRVSVVTALSPRAIIDILFVVAEAARLIRALAEIYGGRPGGLGFLRLVRAVVAHLAVTGGVALGDEALHQLVGQGLAARLSARLGEGVLNGLLTARVGLAAIDSCRPLSFTALPRPTVTDVAGALWQDPAGQKAS
jgi:putative membrane protein